MATAPLVDLGTFDLTGVGQAVTVFSEAKVGGGPGQTGQVILNNYSNFLLSVTDTSLGPLLDLQPGTANVYDPPKAGGSLVVRVKSGSASPTSFLTAQVALAGEEIQGAWPQTLSSIAVGASPDIPAFVTVPNPPAGSDVSYTLPGPGPQRLASFRASLITSSDGTARLPYLQQVVGQFLVESLLTPDPIVGNEQVIMAASPGAAPEQRQQQTLVAEGTLTTTTSTLFAPGGTSGILTDAAIALFNASASTASYSLSISPGPVFAYGSLATNQSVQLSVPPLSLAYVLQGSASLANAISYILWGTYNVDNRRVTSFSGLLLPPGAVIQTTTEGLQPGDAWEAISLAFTAS